MTGRLHRSLPVILFFKNFLSSEQWQQVNGTEYDDPYAIDEVPVHLGRFNRKMSFS
jgi:hypothetical protein